MMILLIDVWICPICRTGLTLLLLVLLLLVLHLLAGSASSQERFETTPQIIITKGISQTTPPIGTGSVLPGCHGRGWSLTVVGAVDVLDGIGPGPAGRGSIATGMRMSMSMSMVATAAATTILVPCPPAPLLMIGRRSRRGLARFVPAHTGRLAKPQPPSTVVRSEKK